jgi:hypothetical protein
MPTSPSGFHIKFINPTSLLRQNLWSLASPTLILVQKFVLMQMAEYPEERYQYEALPTKTSFRVLELLPGVEGDPISCLLRSVHWADLPVYEAISYAWGDPMARAPVIVDGKSLDVTVNLRRGLKHFRYQDRSRVLWADAIW